MANKDVEPGPQEQKKHSLTLVVLLVVFALFGGVLLAKAMTGRSATAATGTGGATAAAGKQTGAQTITTVHNDAVADYEAALKTGKPVYLLFHSLSCQPCVEISAVVDGLMPEYEGRVVFVNAISDDAPARQLAAQFKFQYIPTSFFIAPDGTVADSFTGAMDETQMRGRLDALVGEK